MKKLLLLTLITATLFIAGCKKSTNDTLDPVPTPVPAQKVSLISSDITYYRNSSDTALFKDTTLYKYDNQNRLIEIYHNIKAGPTTSSNYDYKFTYSSTDRVIQLDIYNYNSLYQRNFYTYNNSTSVTENTVYYSNGSLTPGSYNHALSMNANQFVTKRDYGGNYYYTFNYDNSNNISSYSYYAPTNLTTPQYSYTYSYDNNKSRFSNIKGNFYIYINQTGLKNNVISYSYSSIGNSTISFFYSYQYNTDGYPTKLTQTNSVNSNTLTHYYTYITQ